MMRTEDPWFDVVSQLSKKQRALAPMKTQYEAQGQERWRLINEIIDREEKSRKPNTNLQTKDRNRSGIRVCP